MDLKIEKIADLNGVYNNDIINSFEVKNWLIIPNGNVLEIYNNSTNQLETTLFANDGFMYDDDYIYCWNGSNNNYAVSIYDTNNLQHINDLPAYNSFIVIMSGKSLRTAFSTEKYIVLINQEVTFFWVKEKIADLPDSFDSVIDIINQGYAPIAWSNIYSVYHSYTNLHKGYIQDEGNIIYLLSASSTIDIIKIDVNNLTNGLYVYGDDNRNIPDIIDSLTLTEYAPQFITADSKYIYMHDNHFNTIYIYDHNFNLVSEKNNTSSNIIFAYKNALNDIFTISDEKYYYNYNEAPETTIFSFVSLELASVTKNTIITFDNDYIYVPNENKLLIYDKNLNLINSLPVISSSLSSFRKIDDYYFQLYFDSSFSSSLIVYDGEGEKLYNLPGSPIKIINDNYIIIVTDTNVELYSIGFSEGVPEPIREIYFLDTPQVTIQPPSANVVTVISDTDEYTARKAGISNDEVIERIVKIDEGDYNVCRIVAKQLLSRWSREQKSISGIIQLCQGLDFMKKVRIDDAEAMIDEDMRIQKLEHDVIDQTTVVTAGDIILSDDELLARILDSI